MLKNKGFTLIELLIVIAIIAILAGIALTNYRQFVYRIRTSEAKINISMIKTAELAWAQEHDAFVYAAPQGNKNPATNPSVIWNVPQNSGFSIIGFFPSGKVYYAYEIGPQDPGTGNVTLGSTNGGDPLNLQNALNCQSGDPNVVCVTDNIDFWILVLGDINKNSKNGGYKLSDENNEIINISPGEF